MSGFEQATQQETTPNFGSNPSDVITPEERAAMYGGETQEAPAEPTEPTQETVQPETQEQPTKEDYEAGEVEIDENGNLRNKQTGRYVPRSAYMRQKDLNKDLQEKYSKISEDLIRMRERNAIFEELGGKSPDAPKTEDLEKPEMIDPTEDIFGAFQQLVEHNKKLEARIEEYNQSNTQRFEQQQTADYFKADAARFASQTPDFDKALQHATAAQDKLLEQRGIIDPGKRQEMIVSDLRDLIADSKTNGKSWAETVYAMAQTFGYQAAPKEDNGQANGQPAVDPKALSEIERINKAQSAAAPLRNAGGAAPEALTVARLANANDAEYSRLRAEFIAKNGAAKWNALIGGG